MSTVTYAHGAIADKTYAVTAGRFTNGADTVEFKLGSVLFSRTVTGIEFYTGFAGCPARYYVRFDYETRVATIVNA